MQKGRSLFQQVIHSPRWIIVGILKLYRLTLSPDHSWLARFFPNGVCKFYPSCSTYTQEAVEKHGVICGMWLGIKRILRCNPWSKGGFDSVP